MELMFQGFEVFFLAFAREGSRLAILEHAALLLLLDLQELDGAEGSRVYCLACATLALHRFRTGSQGRVGGPCRGRREGVSCRRGGRSQADGYTLDLRLG